MSASIRGSRTICLGTNASRRDTPALADSRTANFSPLLKRLALSGPHRLASVYLHDGSVIRKCFRNDDDVLPWAKEMLSVFMPNGDYKDFDITDSCLDPEE